VSHTTDPSVATVDSFKARVTLVNNNWCLKLFFLLREGFFLRPARTSKFKHLTTEFLEAFWELQVHFYQKKFVNH